MKRLTAGLAVSALATAATVLGMAAPALASSPTCRVTAHTPYLSVGDVTALGDVSCSATATYTFTVTLWRNNGNGTYKSYPYTYKNLVDTGGTFDNFTTCVTGNGTRQWHTEVSISWKIYHGSSLQASGSSSSNSSDIDLGCN